MGVDEFENGVKLSWFFRMEIRKGEKRVICASEESGSE